MEVLGSVVNCGHGEREGDGYLEEKKEFEWPWNRVRNDYVIYIPM
jgi:hypothetical protein